MDASITRDRGEPRRSGSADPGPRRAGTAAARLALLVLGLVTAGVAGADPARTLIGIATPAATFDHGPEVAGAVPQHLAQALAGPGAGTVILHSGTAGEAETEARAQGCGYVLYLQLQQSHASSLGGFLKKVAPLAGAALPGLGALGGRGDVAGALSQVAASAAQSAAQQQAMAQMAAAQQSTVKSGDTMTLEYRLVAAGDARVVHADKLQAKATTDGEDVIGPLVVKAASGVAGSLGGAAAEGAGLRSDAGGASPATAKEDSQGSKHGLGAIFRGAFGGGSPPPAPSANPQAVDCESIARMPGATMSVESCRQMMGAQRAYQAASADPSAARPGDAALSCKEIMAQIREQQYAAPDQQKVARAQDAGAALQKTLANQQATITATAAREQVELDAAVAADRAAETASYGLAKPRTALAVQEKQFADNRVLGDELAKARAPQEQRLYSTTGDLTQDAAKQIAANPRLARLIQLANDKQCHD